MAKKKLLKEAIQLIVNEILTMTTQEHRKDIMNNKDFVLGCPECQLYALLYLLDEFKKGLD